MPSPVASRNVQEALLQREIDPHLTKSNLSALITEALGTSSQCDGYEILTGGCWNRVISASINGGSKHLVIKISPELDAPLFAREFTVLRFFRAHTLLPVPEAFLLDQSGKWLPGSLIVMEKVPGVAFQQIEPHLNDKQRASLSREIACHLANLHRIKAQGFGRVELPPEARAATWADEWLPRFDQVAAELDAEGLPPEDLLVGVGQIRGHLWDLLNVGKVGTLTHHDVWTGNVMVDFRGDHPFVSAFLDVSGYYADYARELSAMFELADEQFMEAYSLEHPFDHTFYVRIALYTFKMCLQLISMYPSTLSYLDRARKALATVRSYIACHPESDSSNTPLA